MVGVENDIKCESCENDSHNLSEKLRETRSFQ